MTKKKIKELEIELIKAMIEGTGTRFPNVYAIKRYVERLINMIIDKKKN